MSGISEAVNSAGFASVLPADSFASKTYAARVKDFDMYTEIIASERPDAVARKFKVKTVIPAIASYDGGTFTLLEKFDGYVLSVADDSFDARMVPSAVNGPSVDGTFSKSELSEEDQALLSEGAPFVLMIGKRKVGSTLKREASFYMRRCQPLSDEHVEQYEQRARTLSERIEWAIQSPAETQRD